LPCRYIQPPIELFRLTWLNAVLQFAKAAGARVIATTSSAEKGETLKKLGADHVLNYKENPNWGEEAKKLTGGVGCHHVVEVAGPSSLAQSLKAVRFEGVISIIGFRRCRDLSE
jgi:NADPH:quinone reductase-like Zn-dependent oxidoreductase